MLLHLSCFIILNNTYILKGTDKIRYVLSISHFFIIPLFLKFYTRNTYYNISLPCFSVSTQFFQWY